MNFIIWSNGSWNLIVNSLVYIILYVTEFQEAFIIHAVDDDKRVNKDQAALVMRSIGLCPTNTDLNEMLSDSK